MAWKLINQVGWSDLSRTIQIITIPYAACFQKASHFTRTRGSEQKVIFNFASEIQTASLGISSLKSGIRGIRLFAKHNYCNHIAMTATLCSKPSWLECTIDAALQGSMRQLQQRYATKFWNPRNERQRTSTNKNRQKHIAIYPHDS